MENKEIVKQIIEAFLNADVEKALSHMTDDIEMGWPGFFDLAPGKDAIRNFFAEVPQIVSSRMDTLISEGDTVIGTGSMTSKHKDGSLKNSFFSDVYEMHNGKVRRIRSYMVFQQDQVPA